MFRPNNFKLKFKHMKKNYTLLLSFLMLFALSSLKAQTVVKSVNGVPQFIKFDNKKSTVSVNQGAALLRKYLPATKDDHFVKISSDTDKIGFVHEKFQQYFKNIKVEYAVYNIHAKGNAVKSMNGEFLKISKLNITPKLQEKEALQKALQYVGAEKYMWEDKDNEAFARETEKNKTFYPKGELVIVRNYKSTNKLTHGLPVLAYKFNIYAQKPLSRAWIYVDAHTGEIVQTDDIIKDVNNESNHSPSMETEIFSNPTTSFYSPEVTANAATRYSGSRNIETQLSGSSYILHDLSRGNGIFTYNMLTGIDYNAAIDFTDNDNNWTALEYDNTAKDNAALDAHWGAEMTYDYWGQKHGRNSYDGNGAAIKSYVHYDVAYDNAYWNGSVMTYGDGSDTYFDALTALDVCGHEIGHAVCSSTANLTYSNESGAMNEGLSDIWGASIEYFAAPEKQTWLIGEDIERRVGHVALRSMSDPKSEGQPDTYKGVNWYTGTADNGGVHTNSGVLNHWYYLLSVGGSGTNDLGNSFSVIGVGIDVAAAIVWRMENVYMTASSTYADARIYSIQAAADLYGSTSNQVQQTTNAWYAVGVGSAYGVLNYCSSNGQDASYEWIAMVSIGSFSNSSGSAGYTDFTTQTVNLTAGNTYSVSLTPGFASSSYNEYFKIWIDLNHDGDFADAGELVYDAGALSSTAVTGSLTIPVSTAAVKTRMRVSMKYNGAQTACESFPYGEVEDYTVNITAGTADTQAPTAPANLTASSVTQTSLTLNWTASSDNVGVKEYRIYKNSILLGTVTGTSANVTGLLAATSYSFYVIAADAAGNVSAASNTLNVTTSSASSGAPTGYCTSNGSNASYEWIDLVQLGSINHTSGSDGGYADNTALSTNLTLGTSNTIYMSTGFSGSSYTEYWAVYIDYNRDGDFADTGEKIVSGSSSSSATLSASFTVPTAALTGLTRMRVSMKYNAAQTPCETFSYGEVEDYTVNLTTIAVNGLANFSNPSAITLGNVHPSYYIYPNPATDFIQLNMMSADNEVNLAIYNMNGEKIKALHLTGNHKINIADLPAGMYTITINDGRKLDVRRFVKH